MFIANLFERKAAAVKVIYAGRFHPFHRGHKAVYDYLVKKFGVDNVFIVTSDKQDAVKSPFSFEEKKRMMMLTGVDPAHIKMSTAPYRAQELVATFDPNTILLFAVSAKDMAEDPRFKFGPKKDGSPSYFQPFTDLSQCVTFDKAAYMMTVPTFNFTVLGKPANSATQIRNQFATADEETQKKIVADLFGKFDHRVYTIMRSKLVHAPAPVTETIVKVGSEYELKSHTGKNLGKYPTRAGAEKREKQVNYFKHVKEDSMSIDKKYGVKYKVFAGREGRLTTKEYWTTSSEKLEKAVEKIENLDNFYEIDGYSYPPEETAVTESAQTAEYYTLWEKWKDEVVKYGGKVEHTCGGVYHAIGADDESFGRWDENTGEGYIDFDQESPSMGSNDSLGESVGDVVTVHQHRNGVDMGRYGRFNIDHETPTAIIIYDHTTGELLKFNRATGRGVGPASQLMLKSDDSLGEGFTVVPGFDREKYQERQGLEGPFHTKSGKVVYYDPHEGSYYDPDTDMYIEYDDWRAMNESTVNLLNPAHPLSPFNPVNPINTAARNFALINSSSGGTVSLDTIYMLLNTIKFLAVGGVLGAAGAAGSLVLNKARSIAKEKSKVNVAELFDVMRDIKRISRVIDKTKNIETKEKYQSQLESALITLNEIKARVKMKANGDVTEQKVSEAGKKGMSAHAKEVAAKSKKYYNDAALAREKNGETYNYGNAKVTKDPVTQNVVSTQHSKPIITVNETVRVVFICKFEKAGKLYSLWQKGEYWYELTVASQQNVGSYKTIKEWNNLSLEEVMDDLKKNGYTVKQLKTESNGDQYSPTDTNMLKWLKSNPRYTNKTMPEKNAAYAAYLRNKYKNHPANTKVTETTTKPPVAESKLGGIPWSIRKVK